MARKKRATGGAPTWMVTFADMMALLLCLFVLLLSFSTMDAKKFRQIAGELQDAFGLSLKTQLLGVIETGGVTGRSYATGKGQTVDLPPPNPEDVENGGMPIVITVEAEPVETTGERVARQLEDELYVDILSGRMAVEPLSDGVLIRFDSKYLFESGSSEVYEAMAGVLGNLASILAETDGEILVSGHTDDVPISNHVFRSNWDLSAARASSLVHMLLDSGKIDKGRIGATGYADSRPIASNETAEGRAQNRRVEIQLRTSAVTPAPSNANLEQGLP